MIGCLSCHYKADSLQRMIARQRVFFTWPARAWFYSGEALGEVKGAAINDKEEVEGGERGLNLSWGKRHAAFLVQSRLDRSLGEKRHPAFCRLWIDCDCPWYKGTRVQVMTVCFWQTPPSSNCSTIWFGRTVAMATVLLDWRPAFCVCIVCGGVKYCLFQITKEVHVKL